MKIIEGGIELIDYIKETWELLNEHHTNKSIFFKERFKTYNFQTRKNDLIEKSKNNPLYIILAYKNDILIGHCVSSIIEHSGEIETIFVKIPYRNSGLGRMFIEKSIEWFDNNNIYNIDLTIAHGNEEVINFYLKFGFVPSGLKLKYKKLNK